MATPAGRMRRAKKEYDECRNSGPEGLAGINVSLASEDDLFTWHVILDGPPNTVYSGGQYGIIVSFPEGWPFKPPVVSFSTRIYHPNVTNDSMGSICLDVLKLDKWKPSTTTLGILQAVRQLLVEPQPDDPLETRIAEEFRGNRKEFDKNARAFVGKYAKGPPAFKGPSPAGEKK